MLNEHIKMMTKRKDPACESIDNLIALIKIYTGNAAYQDMKTVVRNSNFQIMTNYLDLLMRGL